MYGIYFYWSFGVGLLITAISTRISSGGRRPEADFLLVVLKVTLSADYFLLVLLGLLN